MNGQYNIWNKWDPLKTVMLGDCYPAEFFQDIKNNRIRSALTQITDETQEDLAYFESVLKDFGCEVFRPDVDKCDSIMNYIDENGAVQGNQGVPRSPLQPRDCQLVLGNELFYTSTDHPGIRSSLTRYNPNYKVPTFYGPMSKQAFNNYGEGAASWPTYDEYLQLHYAQQPYSSIEEIHAEIAHFTQQEALVNFETPLQAPSITVIGKDIYLDRNSSPTHYYRNEEYFEEFKSLYSNFRINEIKIGGHSDGSFHAVKPGAILSLRETQNYEHTFPDWDVCYLPDQSWEKVDGFLKIKEQVGGKWWVPDQEDNYEFTHFVETWLQDWVGYAEETVFDVNVLVLDEKHVCVNNMNPTVIEFLKKHGMEAVHVPWRHRYFWDGGLHCITLDLYREGTQQDYFPNRTQPVVDKGYL